MNPNFFDIFYVEKTFEDNLYSHTFELHNYLLIYFTFVL